MSELLEVAPRESLGKLNSRRLRREGRLPAVLYGHGKDPMHLAVPEDQLQATMRHGAHVVELKGAAQGQALLQEVQWDTFQQHVLHVDLLRVDASDRVTVEIPIVLRGEAPGEHEGGVLDQHVHTATIETSPSDIPESLFLKISDLHLGGSLKLTQVEGLPKGARFVSDDVTVVSCVEPSKTSDEDEQAEMSAGAEPEVIGRKEDESAGDDS